MSEMLSIAKEITIAAIQNGKILAPSVPGADPVSINNAYTQEVEKFFKNTARTVMESYNKKFD